MPGIFSEIQNTEIKVLIVDDEPNMAKAIQRILKSAGFNTRIAKSGIEAGIWLHYFSPDIMTLDIKMPDINGQQVLNYVRDLTQANSLKVIVVTGTSEQEINAMNLTGAVDIVYKPFRNKVLLEKVSNVSR